MNANRSRLGSVSVNGIGLQILLPSHWRLVVAAIGIGLAALGQVVITSGRVFDWPLLTPLADAVFDMHRQPTAILIGVLLLVAGGVVFAASVSPERRTDDLAGARPGLKALVGQTRRWRLFAAIIALGVAISAVLWLKLALGSYSDVYPFWWAFGIAVAAGAFLYLDRSSGVDLRPRIGLLEVAFVALATGAFILLNLIDLRSWYYSVIGDEYRIFRETSPIARGVSLNFFSLQGEYGILPVAEGYYRAIVMKIFGIDYFGWKLGTTIAGAVVIPPLYLLVRTLFNVRTAVAAVGLLVAAQVMLAYSHAGYDALFAIFPTVLTFALFFPGMKRGSALLIFAAGAAAGLGFYTFYPGRLILPVLLLVLFLYRNRVDLKRDLPILLFGFALVVTPMIVVNNTDIITFMRDQSLFNYDPTIVPDPWDRIKDNIFRNPLAFNYNENEQHFISGSLLEPITAVLAVLGLAYALRRFRRPAFTFLLIWFGIAMAASGIASPHGFTPMIRMSYLIPIVVVFGAIALAKGYEIAQGMIGNNALRTAVPALAMAIVLVAVVGSNLYRFWEVTPENFPNTPGAVAMKALLSDECRQGSGQRLVVTPGALSGSLALAITTRDWSGTPPVMLTYDEIDRVQEFSPMSCVVYIPETEPPSAEDLARIRLQTGAQRAVSEYDDSGQVRVLVLR